MASARVDHDTQRKNGAVNISSALTLMTKWSWKRIFFSSTHKTHTVIIEKKWSEPWLFPAKSEEEMMVFNPAHVMTPDVKKPTDERKGRRAMYDIHLKGAPRRSERPDGPTDVNSKSRKRNPRNSFFKPAAKCHPHFHFLSLPLISATRLDVLVIEFGLCPRRLLVISLKSCRMKIVLLHSCIPSIPELFGSQSMHKSRAGWDDLWRARIRPFQGSKELLLLIFKLGTSVGRSVGFYWTLETRSPVAT